MGMSMPDVRIGIVAALEREVRPLIRGWKVRMIEQSGRRYRLFENANGDCALICGGIGAEAARRATEALIQEVHPMRVVSAGFAGAVQGGLDRSLKVGDVLEPHTVINASDGVRTEIGSGAGILVTSANVAGREQKIRFDKAYGANSVDMEAAAVAQGAEARGVGFTALKAISEGADFDLPDLNRFVAGDGTFRSIAFACHVALRPWLWGATMALARNSSKASRALCGALENYLDREVAADRSSTTPSMPSDGETDCGPMCAGAHTLGAGRSDTREQRKQ